MSYYRVPDFIETRGFTKEAESAIKQIALSLKEFGVRGTLDILGKAARHAGVNSKMQSDGRVKLTRTALRSRALPQKKPKAVGGVWRSDGSHKATWAEGFSPSDPYGGPNANRNRPKSGRGKPFLGSAISKREFTPSF